MAEPRNDLVDTPGPGETRKGEKERSESPDKSGDTAVGRENVEDVDPDSAQSDIDRDDTGAD